VSENGLPSGWARVTLADIAEINPKWWSEDPCDDTPVSFIRMAAVEEESGRIDLGDVRKWRAVSKGYTRFQEGDVIFAKITPCMENGKSAVARGLQGGRATGSTEFHVLRPTSAISADLLRYFLVQVEVRNRARMYMKGAAGQLRVSPEYLRALEFLLPPRLEQGRIVSETETLLTDLDVAVAGLKRAQANLKRYRASVLKAACEGRLVPTEAELARKEGCSYESGEQLLQRILKERRAKWEADQLAKMHASGKPPKDDNWKQKCKEPAAPETAGLPALPEGWTPINLGQVTWSVKDGPHYSPKYSDSGVPFITGGQVRPSGVDFGAAKYISPELHSRLIARCRPERNDVLYTKGGTTGIARVNTYDEEFSVWVHVAVLKLVDSADPFFIQHALNSPSCYRQSQRYTHGVGNQDLGLTRMVWITFGLPPTAEQKRIVEEVDLRLSVVDEIEGSVEAQLKRASRLRQSILKRAFEGKLVPQNPNDEPASVLLELLRAERVKPQRPNSKSKSVGASS